MRQSFWKYVQAFYKHVIALVIIILLLFTLIGFITTANTASKIQSKNFSAWLEEVDFSFFTLLYSMENHAFDLVYPLEQPDKFYLDGLLKMVTSIRFQDASSLLGQEIPGFSTYENTVIIAGEKLDDIDSYSHESGPPLEIILEDREAVDAEEEQKDEEEKTPEQTTDGREVVFLYNSHNRESFLPHLPDETDTDHAYHEEVNITKISDHLKENLEKNGIGTMVDDTDIMQILNDKGWKYGKSYDASRPVVETALDENDDLQYVVDVHRDSLPRDKTTKEIDDTNYATILFVIGAEHKNFEKNLELATALHKKIEKTYPGLSKGVIQKEGANSNGVYNQDMSDNAILIEVGGFENSLEEMYRTADVFSEVFTEYYWDAEKVSK
ncbi:MAG TPA: stage II sporulation protein P [Pseudogracilibacillus sp.]|nr:stage II sporulation protein P [Pseudogracilibacillus sp.]